MVKKVLLFLLVFGVLYLVKPWNGLAYIAGSADINLDGVVDILDINELYNQFGNQDGISAYTIVNQPEIVEISCALGDVNCNFYESVVFRNTYGSTLYQTTLSTSTSGPFIEFQAGGGWTSDPYEFPQNFEDGYGPNILVHVEPQDTLGTSYARLGISGRDCNPGTNPPDCYVVGGAQLTFKITVYDPAVGEPAILQAPAADEAGVGYCVDVDGATGVVATFKWLVSSSELEVRQDQRLLIGMDPAFSDTTTRIVDLNVLDESYTTGLHVDDMNVLDVGENYYWRVDTNVSGGWFESDVNGFSTNDCL